jgi:hypothetical protein
MSDSFLRALVYLLCFYARLEDTGTGCIRVHLGGLKDDFDVADLRGRVCEKRIIICPISLQMNITAKQGPCSCAKDEK